MVVAPPAKVMPPTVREPDQVGAALATAPTVPNVTNWPLCFGTIPVQFPAVSHAPPPLIFHALAVLAPLARCCQMRT